MCEQEVGKTSIVTRFVNDGFHENYSVNIISQLQFTVGIDMMSKVITVKSKPVKIQLWDTAGQERFKCLIPSYIKQSHVVIIVYDVTSKVKTLLQGRKALIMLYIG